MLTRICLVRHAETEWNRLDRLQGHQDLPLNDRGRAQAREAAARVRGEDWDAIVSSPLRRATQTARIVAQVVGVPFVGVDPLLIERSYGVAAGLTPTELDRRYVDGDVPGMESRADVASRGLTAMQRLYVERAGQRVLAITHGSLVKCVLLWLRPDLPAASLDVTLLSATVVEWDGFEWSVRVVGTQLGNKR